MAWFRRTQSSEPTSLEQYYSDKGRGGIRSWLFALAAFVVTLILVFGVFWAGRWLYRKATHKDPVNVATQKAEGDPFAGATIDQPTTPTTKSTSTNTSTTTNNTQTANPQTQGTSTTTTKTQTSSTNSDKTPNTKITNTGPGDTVALFATTTVVAMAAYQLRLRRQNEL